LRPLDTDNVKRELPQKFRLQAKVSGVLFDLIFTQIDGAANNPTLKNKVYVHSDSKTQQQTTQNLVTNF
jgi:hypothetical protein